jgi:multiple sugar transport system permease protein
MKGRGRAKAGNILYYLVLGACTVVSLAPFLFALLSSFKAEAQINTFSWLPRPFTLGNYSTIFKEAPLFGRWILNSLGVAVVSVFFQVFLAALTGFVFARMRFPGRNALFMVMLASMMFPGQLSWIPNFVTLSKLHLVNTYAAVILPGLVSASGVFLMTQFFRTFPKELEEAARIDGCTRWEIFTRILLPLAKPVLASFAVMSFMSSWNSFTWPVIVLNSPDLFTLPLGLQYFQGMNKEMWGYILAGSMFNAFPVIMVFAVFQRFLVRGVATTGLKG